MPGHTCTSGCVCSPTRRGTHTPAERKAPASQCLCPANARLIFQTVSACSLQCRDNASDKHYNQQAREVTASARITTAEKCLPLAISMSAALTSSHSSTSTSPSAGSLLLFLFLFFASPLQPPSVHTGKLFSIRQ